MHRFRDDFPDMKFIARHIFVEADKGFAAYPKDFPVGNDIVKFDQPPCALCTRRVTAEGDEYISTHTLPMIMDEEEFTTASMINDTRVRERSIHLPI